MSTQKFNNKRPPTFSEDYHVISFILRYWKSIGTILVFLCTSEYAVVMLIDGLRFSVERNKYELEIQSQNAQIKNKDSQIEELCKDVDKLEKQAEKQAEKIEKLNQELFEKKEQINELENQLNLHKLKSR